MSVIGIKEFWLLLLLEQEMVDKNIKLQIIFNDLGPISCDFSSLLNAFTSIYKALYFILLCKYIRQGF